MSNIKVYKASAGTGKTFSLVKEYLKIALKNPGDFGNILCITFTNKAAEEMKSRIISDLRNLSLDNPEAEGIRKAIEADTGIDNIPQRASTLLNKILHNYSYFSVSTIDKFFIGILKSFARELNLKLGFEIQLNEDEILNEIIPETINRFREDEFATNMILEFTNIQIEKGKSWDFKDKLTRTAKLIFKDEYYKNLKDGISEVGIKNFYDTIRDFKNNFEQKIQNLAKEAFDELTSIGFDVNDFKGKGTTSVYRYLQKLAHSYDPGEIPKLRQYSDDVSSWVGAKETPHDNMVLAYNGITGTNIHELLKLYDTEIKHYNTSCLVLDNFNLYVILNRVQEVLKEYRDTNNAVLISDVYRLIKPLIESNDAPFIYEKSGNRYKYFLIDEAQDTSELQWLNLMPLLKNSIAEGGQVIIVGDVKQSVYKFRNAFPQQFINLDKEFTEVENISLEESRRSLQEIVNFNNDLFDAVKTHINSLSDESLEKSCYSKKDLEVIYKAYDNHEHKTLKGNAGGYVKLKLFRKAKSVDAEEDSERDNHIEAELFSDVQRIINAGYKPGDILILVDRHVTGAKLASALSDAGFEVVSSASRLLTASPKVRLLIALFRYLENKYDEVSLTEVLNYICNSEGEDFFEMLKSSSLSEIAKEKLQNISLGSYSYLSSLPVYEMLENILRKSSLKFTYDSYLVKFIDTVFKFSVEKENDLESFLEWWDAHSDELSISGSSSSNAIEVMTIHSAKGLERDIVMIPYADWDLNFKWYQSVWMSTDEEPFSEFGKLPVLAKKDVIESLYKEPFATESSMQLLDRINLTYVAFTRPKHGLFIYSTLNDKNFDKDESLKIPTIPNCATDLLLMLVTQNQKYKLDSDLQFESSELKYYKTMSSESEITKTYTPTEIPVTDWQKKLRIKTYYSDLYSSGSDKRILGNIMHDLLSMINNREDIEPALQFMYNSGKLTGEQVDTFRNELNGIFQIEGIESVFPGEAKVIIERDILTPTGEIFRPDRVIEVNGKIFVIDFKTGLEQESHKKQINEYAEILSEIYDTKDITKLILYTADKKLEVVK